MARSRRSGGRDIRNRPGTRCGRYGNQPGRQLARRSVTSVASRLSNVDFTTARDAHVVLDATEIHRDWFLAGLEFQLLRFLVREAGIRAVVPSSVVAEVVANQSREYTAARTAYAKAVQSLRRVGGRNLVSAANAPEDSPYAQVLSARFESIGVEVLDLPATPHSEIVARAVSRKPPFDQNGSGYRDTLTWLTCVELAFAGKAVYLVSQDNDFAGRDGQLAPELAEELAGARGSVTLVRQLGKWLTPLIPWDEATNLPEAAAIARDEELLSMFAPWDRFEDMHFTAEDIGLPTDAVIHEIRYHGTGNGVMERVKHTRDANGADRIFYQFPIEFELDLSISTEGAKAAGLIQGARNPTGLEHIKTVVPMNGFMQVVHDEHDIDQPLVVDWMDFRVAGAAGPAWATDELEQPGDPR